MAETYIPQYELVALLGLRAALQLCERFGGTEIYIPRFHHNKKPDHEIINAIGLDAACRLSEKYHGQRLELPMAKHMRREEVLNLVEDKKLSKSQAALQLGLTTRWVRSLTNGIPEDDKLPADQPDFFD